MNKSKQPHKKLGFLLGVLGVALALGGWKVYSDGASGYFLGSGILLFCSGFLLNTGLKLGAYMYSITFVVMVFWSIYDVGVDFNKLFTRLAMPLTVLIYVFSAKVFKNLR